MATYGFARVGEGRPISTAFLCELNALLMRGMPLAEVSGRLRDEQVVIGRRADADLAGFAIHAARFVPAPAGSPLETGLRDLVNWLRTDHAGRIDPVVAASMAHYQFETLHPFRDGNGRLGRLLVVLHLQQVGVLQEPTLTVSPWFEARRAEYYDRLLAVSTDGDWDAFVGFFATGLQAAAELTRRQMIALVTVQSELKDVVRRQPTDSARPTRTGCRRPHDRADRSSRHPPVGLAPPNLAPPRSPAGPRGEKFRDSGSGQRPTEVVALGLVTVEPA